MNFYSKPSFLHNFEQMVNMDKNKNMESGEMATTGSEIDLAPLSENRNPLLNDLVLKTLFQFCPLADLPRLRLVSKKWHAVASERFRRDVPAVFENPWSSSGRLRFESFFEWDPEEMPFGYFRMKSMHIGQLPGESETSRPVEILTFRQNIGQFWGRYGSYIRKLELWYPIVHSVEAFKNLILEETPNLEELSLLDIRDKTGGTSPSGNFDGGNVRMQLKLKRLVVNPLGSLPVGWDILRHFPNIQNVEVTPRHSMDIGTVGQHLTKISEQLSGARRPSRITVHQLKFRLRSEHHVTLSKRILNMPQLRLPKLHVSIDFLGGEDYEMDMVSTAFRHHGENLEDVYVCSRLPYDNFIFKYGPFNSVTSIDFRGNVCENLHFLQHFPNLKILQLLYFDSAPVPLERTDSTIMETFTLHHLRELRLSMETSCAIPKDAMEMLVKVMPKVEKFEGPLSNASLSVLCREWKQLKVLRFGTFESRLCVNDEGITGIVLGREERLPNITDLKALETLSFNRTEKGLSDTSIWNGFLQMPNLKNLCTKISPKASWNAYKALREKFPDICYVSTRDN